VTTTTFTDASPYSTQWSSYRFVGAAFVVICLFPWLSFGLLDLDTQPWFIMAAIVVCALSINLRADRVVILGALSLSMIAIAGGLGHMVAADFLFIRGVLSYTAFGLVLLAYYFYRRKYGFPIRIFVTANIIWLLAGAFQLFAGFEALESLVTVRTSSRRGVTGLAPEPSFYGTMLLFLSWIFFVERGYRLTAGLWLLVLVNFVYILLVAKSAIALVSVMGLLALYIIVGVASLRRFLYVVALAALVVVATLVLNEYFPDWRIMQIVMSLARDPLLAVRVDASMNERLAHLTFSVYGAIMNGGLPGGFNSFAQTSIEARAYFGDLFWYGGAEDKIMSGIGAVIFELGWFAIVFFLVVAFCTLSARRPRIGIFHFIGFLALFGGALPVAFPMAPILLITMLFWRRTYQAPRATAPIRARPLPAGDARSPPLLA
jgi:hypothetical protein